ncbi:DUF6436 domain-containing protein [Pseudoalteromonas sp. SMN1298-MNA-CIBAN-0114]|uniref:DUF6436 domain-containing protein n=1 Tax=Pseudoalteromonas sp. SMN1298-MNA-CIBAN-0114 TaxID=3140428 RepID=UPI00331E62C9
MPSLNKSNTFIFSLIATWLICVVAGLVYFQLEQLKPFDSSKILLQKHWFSNFKKQLDWVDTGEPSLVLITEKNCGCTIQAKPHISSLTSFATNKGMKIVQVELTPILKHVIPATPAAVIINKAGEFVYAGPLSEGLACAQGSGFVETVVTNLAAGFNSKLLITQTKGCYCVNNA